MELTSELIIERLQVLLSSSIIFALFFMVAFRNGYFDIGKDISKSEDKIFVKNVLIAFAIFLLTQAIIVPIIANIFIYLYAYGEIDKDKELTKQFQSWFSVFSIVICALTLDCYISRLSKEKQRIIWGEKPFIFKDFLLALFTWFLSYPLVVALGQIVSLIISFIYKNIDIEQVAVKQLKTSQDSIYQLFALSFCIVVIVPIIEELLFRGFLQNWLKSMLGRWKAIILTSLIFAFFHFATEQGVGNIELIFSLFILSCFLGFLYERQKTLWASISLHAIFNAISILLILSFKS